MKKPGKKTSFRKSGGKLLLDLGKLAVGGIIIGGILRGEVPPVILIVSGSEETVTYPPKISRAFFHSISSFSLSVISSRINSSRQRAGSHMG